MMDAITKRRIVARLATELVGALDETLLAALRELAEVNHALHEAGIDYPTGARGVADLHRQRDGQIERAEEAERELAALRVELAEANNALREAVARRGFGAEVWPSLPSALGSGPEGLG